ncbi:GldG family protein [Terasakiispira papahanaumokuakeensis]|nr:Gldg family protein [Terasakiispira papahanaumokuakeensis]
MMRTIQHYFKQAPGRILLGLAMIFVLAVAFGDHAFRSWRWDMTEDQLYSLSPATETLVSQIQEPMILHFYYSRDLARDLPQIRSYAERVQTLLQRYAAISKGKLKLEVVNPEPFSKAEDEAVQFGLQGVEVDNSGRKLYLGLAVTNSVDKTQTIPFLRASQEPFLEYDIGRIIDELSNRQAPVMGLMSGLPMEGQFNFQTRQPPQPWAILSQWRDRYRVKDLTAAANADVKPDVLVLVAPQYLDQATLDKADQWVKAGTPTLVVVDPKAEMAGPQPPKAGADAVHQLLAGWGVQYDPGQVVGDLNLAMKIGLRDGSTQRHPALLRLETPEMASQAPVNRDLEQLVLSTAGAFSVNDQGQPNAFEPLLSTTPEAALQPISIYADEDPTQALDQFQAGGQTQVLAAQYHGHVPGHEDQGLNLILVGDSDFLSDRLWARYQQFYGQTVLTPWSDNGSWLSNAVDQLAGGSALMDLRGQGRHQRPFVVVDQLQRQAEQQFSQKAEELKAQLADTEQRLQALQQERQQTQQMTLSPQQEKEVQRFIERRSDIRQALRQVQHQLDRQIDTLGAWLKFINIGLVPLLLILAYLFWAWRRRHSVRHQLAGHRSTGQRQAGGQS